jgi:2-oxoglutarate dehydrogenase complex dehydrogenase (E1) component-like enzyme
VIVDLVCYRRNGHNELDDARSTLPRTCAAIDAHAPVLQLYGRKLDVGLFVVGRGVRGGMRGRQLWVWASH